MPEYCVTWECKFTKTVEAPSQDEAVKIIEDLDCATDGEYCPGSFEILSIEKLLGEKGEVE
ncbi:MAG: hypothetical protein M0Z67_02615 [Nitrospiraceae bacterium]|nr:hypothetical protein [Nitrospiraceae bacterium]